MAMEIIQEYVFQILCSKKEKYNHHKSRLIHYIHFHFTKEPKR